jgi:hypothetical protein
MPTLPDTGNSVVKIISAIPCAYKSRYATSAADKFEKPPCTGYCEGISPVAAMLVKKNGMQE